jgi:hypothetical protein
MAAVTFTPASGSVAFTDGESLAYETAGVYCSGAKVSGRTTRTEIVNAPGEFGSGTQYFAGGKQMIVLDLIYVDSSEQNCSTEYQTDMFHLSAGTFGMTIGSDPFAGCVLMDAPLATQPKRTGVAATYKMEVSITILCTRP